MFLGFLDQDELAAGYMVCNVQIDQVQLGHGDGVEMSIVRHVSYFVLGEDEKKASIYASPFCGAECACNICKFHCQNFDGSRGGLSHNFGEGSFTQGCFHHISD